MEISKKGSIFVTLITSALFLAGCSQYKSLFKSSALGVGIKEVAIDAGEVRAASTTDLNLTCTRSGSNYSVKMDWTIPAGATQNVVRNRPAGQGWSMSNYQPLASGVTTHSQSGFSKGQVIEFNVKFTPNVVSSYLQLTFSEAACPETSGGGGGGSSGGGGGSGPFLCASDSNLEAFCRRQSEVNVPNMFGVVQQTASERPDLISQCARHNSAFNNEVVKRLRQSDQRWGFNWVRGNVGDVNGDTVSYWFGSGSPQEGGEESIVIDIVGSCGDGGSNTPTWGVMQEYETCCQYGKMRKWTLQPLN